MFVKYTYVDAKTGIPTTEAKSVNGFKNPNAIDLQFKFAEESQYPTETPIFYGVMPEQPPVVGVLSILTEEEFNAAKELENYRRRVKRIPETITVRQARIVLSRHGILQDVQGLIDALPEPDKTEAQISWEFASHYSRNDRFVIMLAAGLELTEEELDEMFIEASEL